MAALAVVWEAADQKPELQQDSPDAGPAERFLASLQLNQTLRKPHPKEQSRCVCPAEYSVAVKGIFIADVEKPIFVSVIEVLSDCPVLQTGFWKFGDEALFKMIMCYLSRWKPMNFLQLVFSESFKVSENTCSEGS